MICDKCRKRIEEFPYTYYTEDSRFDFCKKCHMKLKKEINLLIGQYSLQPERLSEKAFADSPKVDL